jgi:hypothetical protein
MRAVFAKPNHTLILAQVHQREILDGSGLLSTEFRLGRASRERELRVQSRFPLGWQHMPAILFLTGLLQMKEKWPQC